MLIMICYVGLRLQTAHSPVVRGICVLSAHGEQSTICYDLIFHEASRCTLTGPRRITIAAGTGDCMSSGHCRRPAVDFPMAGCPDRARGAVLHQPHIIPDQREMQYTAVLPDSNPYGYLSIMSEASKANDRSGKSQAVGKWPWRPSSSESLADCGTLHASSCM